MQKLTPFRPDRVHLNPLLKEDDYVHEFHTNAPAIDQQDQILLTQPNTASKAGMLEHKNMGTISHVMGVRVWDLTRRANRAATHSQVQRAVTVYR